MEEQPAIAAVQAPEQAEFKQEAPAAADGAPGEGRGAGGRRAGRPRAGETFGRRAP